ncbi:hypothetical protein GDO86_016330 [Hymenochirus boettgeri]|uniref:Olfactory receptor n=1 Tax=Hymenochirus boettgeri TaxID=247094 RepID=A0A8T2IRC5_9PIPI|nr:hypothetical protein GDO86_012638 [Hymenochirus boettgeri]KAG8441067.1 hypothetical protein GDO86_006708 [Hymenochirus boettgeri]KAG8444402.1 hypothetical protein GDO86_009549 [Hymenochirus boettgeri]KAG8449646.1 hypothetical protein GDO86_016330 [Hymenochirus boettgeri]
MAETGNYTLHREFLLLAFSRYENLQLVIFISVLWMYLFTLCGNLVIIILVCLVPQLHTPMYFFLCNLSVQDIVCVTAILPKLLDITITGDNRISYIGCIIQMSLLLFCIAVEFFLLTTMAYDRYVAICIPMRYFLIMKRSLCVSLAAVSWFNGVSISVMYYWLVSSLLFCSNRQINNFFCELKTVLEISCSNTNHIKIIIMVLGLLFGLLVFVFILTSYAYIVSAVLKIQVSAGKLKVLSSCCSHITVVVIYCGTLFGVYLKPDSDANAQENDKLLSLLYVVVTPLLNPLVYSLRNKDIANAMKKILKYIFR